MQVTLEALKTAVLEELHKAGHPVEDQELFQSLGLQEQEGFEQALVQLCEEGKLTVTHEKPRKVKVYDAVREFMTPPMARKENQWRPLHMTEDERRRRAFEAAIEKGSPPTRRMLSIPSHAECLWR